MNPEEYAARQAVIGAAVTALVLRLGRLLPPTGLGVQQWATLLQLVYPHVEEHRRRSAVLARTFYDTQREIHHPGLPRNEQLLEGYSFPEFVRDMEPARKKAQLPDSPQDAIGQVALQVVRAVENAGRQQIIRAVENDDVVAEIIEAEREDRPTPEKVRRYVESPTAAVRRLVVTRSPAKAGDLTSTAPQPNPPIKQRKVRGWARIATGRETCAWCLMLISRGPEYSGAGTAGMALSDLEALRLWKESNGDLGKFLADTAGAMKQWHPGCDCKVVPVFDRADWPGMEQAAAALALWNDATSEAIAEEREDRGRKHTRGKNRGERFTRNERAINALRRMLASGEINPSDFAARAA